MKEQTQQSVRFVTVEPDLAGQRVDNFLRTQLKGVPKSMIYRILRKGEVRVNKGRVKPEYKLVADDVVRIPPVRVSEGTPGPSPKLDKIAALESQILFEDERIIVINKPSGIAVHGGSGLSFGLIEGLRALRPDANFMELVHRLDRDTSGCILIAKKRSALRHMHEQLRTGKMDKRYQALVAGQWPENRFKVKAPLRKNVLQSGERMVSVSEDGKPSETRYRILQKFDTATLVEASPITGRTHQIRVHCLHAEHPIACDPKYGDAEFDESMRQKGLNRLFLHAHSISLIHPGTEERVKFTAPLDATLTNTLKALS
ncbi:MULTISPECIES: 23S rRNA pseudouridine(955/2504/2580) synthase RluC [Alteromonas]|uniref:Pseudouridine synthase n=1 Tax=Alteromonas stellipolaris TaxID=233316 RepID=A0AAW7Z8H1_9ALTE|nr:MULTISPECIES: 23S rRNA pseudouridine(955/2504/2580) synthase RluC [Alteromonas]AMJ92628.1 23S rRNA pseudouridylate synthase [Alteromonas sp. Mac2]AMJ76340.1 23S rRNA pseudouridylate synthase [Alteromonas stellipolaris]AMJ88775.1 23S rRNA pseudouridylate synthase [Alteromonas sp. Mac1]AMJ96484.1 23S rRNA pseudouridylate synthase [Alteromonas stellipolaris]ANB23676.1 23S rRNA pseudouridylate synthase [Alteromonas stellipolaris]